MWFFLMLVSFGLVFMLYALVQFSRESRRKMGARGRSSTARIGEMRGSERDGR
jgi:hypothetical protein